MLTPADLLIAMLVGLTLVLFIIGMIYLVQVLTDFE